MPAIKSDGTVLQTKEAQALAPFHWENPNSAGLLSSAGFYVGVGVPGSSLGTGNEFYFRLDGAGGTRVYHKEGGSWVGIV